MARDEMSLVSDGNGHLYAIGGFGGPNNSSLSQVERYSIERNKWEDIGSLNVPRRAMSALSLNGSVYVLGGFDGEKYLSSVEKLELGQTEWRIVSAMNHPRCTFGAVGVREKQVIYAFGGFDNGPMDHVERYWWLSEWEI